MEKRALKKISIFLMLAFILSNVFNLGILKVKATTTYASDLFFSEYIEGSSNNKAIEIYNGTANAVNLSQYSIELYSNGASVPTNTQTLAEVQLASGDVYILANSQASAALLALSDTTSPVVNFNGDDALVLKHNGVVIDSFGQVGTDPGSAWGTGSNTTIDHTLVRKSTVTAGDGDPSDAFEPTILWDIYAKDDFTHLGAHTMDGFGGGTQQQVADVTALPAAGGVYAGTEVTLSTPTDGAAIYYTTDGSDPNPGTLYSTPIVINEGLTIKAKATKAGMLDSNIGSFTYTINTAPVLETIASARAKAVGTIVRVQGKVSRIKGNNKFIQDATAGICIYQSGLTLNEGDLIEATGTLTDYNGLLEMTNVTANVISSGNTVTPQEVTVSQVVEGLESQLIKISNATLGTINTSGSTPITDSTGTINIFKIPALTGIIEGNVVDVIAIASEYNGVYQLTVVRTEDVTLSNQGEEVPVTGITLNAETAEVSVGSTVTLTAVISPPNATNRNVIWTSENNELASVNNGVVTGVGVGTVKITAASEENSNIKDECTITVTPQSDVITIAEARTRMQDSNVKVSGVVTAILDSNKIYVQDATAAIVMDVYNLQNVPTIAQGDSVRFYGRISNYRNLLTIVPEVSRIEILSNNNPLPAPTVVTALQAAGEVYEAQLIKILSATIGAINPTSNTSITDSTGTINIYKIPALTGISEGDNVNVIAIASQYHSTNPASGYQLRVRIAGDVEKVQTPDTEKPVITHTPVTTGNIGEELEIKAQVTDNREVKNVKLFYRTVGQDNYKTINMALVNGEYAAEVPREDLNLVGLEYYIEASDETNTSTSPEDITHPYQVMISDTDVTAPEITDYSPKSGTSTGDNLRPVINVKYSDRSGIDVGNIKLYINGTDVTANTVKTQAELTYTPPSDFTLGEQSIRVIIPDLVVPVANTKDFTWNFYIGEEQFNLYFGQIHSHTSLSDGNGTPDDAYTWARDNAKADFFAVTDHSNSFDNSTGSENITDYRDSTSLEWKQLRETADRYNVDNEFVAIGGYEMTWSGSTGGWGHINTYNTEWFASRNNSAMTLQKYYERIGQDVTSISQLNHPGTTFGDFGDFGFWTPAADRVVNLIEVGNGEGQVRGSGYFPSYEYYTRALDKGWHVAPTNNQDNHKKLWVNANTARTVILAPSLTRQSIFEAMSQRRVYSTEDENLRIKYTVNNQVMGTILQDPAMLNISIEIDDPDVSDVIGKVSIIVDGGRVVQEKTFTSNSADWDLTLDPQYNYYYVRIDQQDRDIAVTAPVWTSEVTPVGLSKVEVSQNPQIVNTPTDLIATIYNNGTTPLSNVLVEFFKNSISTENKIGENLITAVSPAGSEKATINWSPDIVGDIKIYAQAVINVEGQNKTFTASTIFMVANPEDITKIVIDGGHLNQYITGDYPGNIKTLASMMTDNHMMLVQNPDTLTSEDFENAKVLFLTDPAKTVNYTDAEIKAIQDFVNAGGALIITSRADYNDKGVTDPTLQSAAQGNRILEAVGSNLRFNDDEVIDNVSNGGQNYRLYFDDYVSTKYNLTNNIVPGYTYSAYSGCSVILKNQGNDEKVDWLVKGHDTTEILDSDTQGDATPVEKGQVYSLAAEVLSSGSKVIVAGSTFFSDFETATSDNAYSNKQITDNIINWLVDQPEAELRTIAEVRVDANKDGIPDLLGKKFKVEGIVTAQSVGVGTNNSFFDVIYVQDETGGLTIFGVSSKPIPLGTKISVTGTVGQYEGDSQIQIKNENIDVVILDANLNPAQPMTMTTGASMLEENEGWLVKIQGKVKSINTTGGDNSLYIDDGSGVSKVYVNGYIGDGTDNPDMLGKWDPNIMVGDTVSAIGLASEDASGHRIRVRNTAEIVKLGDGTIPVIGVVLSRTSIRVREGRSYLLGVTLQPEDASNKDVYWYSSNPYVAEVSSSGRITAVSEGTAIITVITADGGYSDSCAVEVTPRYIPPVQIYVEGVKLNKTEMTIKVGGKESLNAIVSPGNAYNKELIWTSSKPSIAIVDNGVVTAISAGTAVITVKTVEGGYAATCTVTVIEDAVKATGVSIDKETVNIKTGESIVLKAQVTPENAKNKEVIWSTGNLEIASIDANGKLNGVKAGTTVVTVKTVDGGYIDTCTVTVIVNTPNTSTTNPVEIKKEVVVRASKLNVRLSPSTNGKKVGFVTAGTRLEYLGLENGWYKVSFNGQTAYVSAQYSAYAESQVGSIINTTPTQKQVVITARGGLNVRDKASAGGRKLGLLRYGTKVTVIDTINGWCRIVFNGRTGYISSQYVK